MKKHHWLLVIAMFMVFVSGSFVFLLFHELPNPSFDQIVLILFFACIALIVAALYYSMYRFSLDRYNREAFRNK